LDSAPLILLGFVKLFHVVVELPNAGQSGRIFGVQLEHVLEGAVLLSTGEVIEETDLSIHFYRPEKASSGVASALDTATTNGVTSLEELEKMQIERVLKLNNFSRSRTADALGISKKTLYLKIKRYGMKVND